jgi:hypothetical protein
VRHPNEPGLTDCAGSVRYSPHQILSACQTQEVGGAEQNLDADWYRRFRLPDDQVDAKRYKATRDRESVEEGGDVAELLEKLLELAWALTPLGEECEAVRFGRRAIELARSRGSVAIEIEAMLHTATALQYSTEQAEAEAMFEDGIELCHVSGQDEQLHYFLHHLGRFKAEQLDEASASARFEAAIIEREHRRLDDLAESSRMALAGLRPWIANRQQRTR